MSDSDKIEVEVFRHDAPDPIASFFQVGIKITDNGKIWGVRGDRMPVETTGASFWAALNRAIASAVGELLKTR